MLNRLAWLLPCAALSLGLLSCSSTEVVAPTVSVSIGKQLIDLKNAWASGAISKSEWERQKRQLIDSVK